MTETLKRGFPGMKSVKDMPVLQDSPPPGGFPAIRIDRRMPNSGPTGATIFAVGAAVMAYGYYKVYLSIQERKIEQRALEMTRAPLVPVLQAEEDFRVAAKLRADREREERIMKNVPGWEVGKSNSATGRYIGFPQPIGVWDPTVA